MASPRKRPLHGHLPKLHGVRLKLNRAQAHAEALNREVDAWFGRHPYETFGQYEAGPPEKYLFKVRFFEPVPPDWAVILGDFVHDARSALDHLAYQIVMAGNGGRHSRKSQFPITDNPWQWKCVAKRLKGASTRHITIIESFQPYQRRDSRGYHSITETLDDPLSLLHNLSNIDKHNVLNATPAAFSTVKDWNIEAVKDIEIANPGLLVIPETTLIDGEPMYEIAVRATGPEPEVKLNRIETVEVRVQHRVSLTKTHDALWDYALRDLTDDILARVREIFEVFVGEFR